jgi:hypothetical protein
MRARRPNPESLKVIVWDLPNRLVFATNKIIDNGDGDSGRDNQGGWISELI